MTGRSPYVPRNAVTRWLDQRLPLIRLLSDSFVTYQTPRNLNVWYTAGAILAVMLAIQLATGIALAMHYLPSGALAFASVEGRIMREVNDGWLIRSLHASGASMVFIALYVHLARGIYYGSYKAPREMVWILGVLLYLLMMATAFLGYTLPWGQMSFWGATVITNLFAALDQIVPGAGSAIGTWLRGDFAVGDATLNRFFALHYLLPFVMVAVVGLHIWALHVTGNNNPTGVDAKSPDDTLPFHPYYTVKDALAVVLFLIVYMVIVFYAPDVFANPDNYIPANPVVTPPEIVPEWYLRPFYAMLRAIPSTLLGVLAMVAAVITLFFVPWLDTSKVRSCRYRPLMKQLFWLLIADCVLLGYCGSQSTDAAFSMLGIDVPLVWIARAATLYYFAFFWVAMPWVGKIEVTTPVPETIAQCVAEERGL